MKTYIYGIVGVMCAAVLCGCGSQVPDLTEEQSALITEYATNLLLKHSTVSERNLLDDKELEIGMQTEAEEKARKQKEEEIAKNLLNGKNASNKQSKADSSDMPANKDSSTDGYPSGGMENTVAARTVSEFFEEGNFSIDYISYTLCDFYPENSEEEVFMAMEATEGKQLCILKFMVKNLTSSEQPLDMFVKQGKFSLQMNDTTVVRAQSTLLVEDLSSYAGVLPPNAEEEMVLVFEVSDSISQIGAMQLHMSSAAGENVLSLQ